MWLRRPSRPMSHRARRSHPTLPHRLFTYGATLACVVIPVVSPSALASGHRSTPLVARSAAQHDSGHVITLSATVHSRALPGTTASGSSSRTPHNAAVNSASSAGMFEAVVLFVILAIFSPISIFYIILYRRARRDVNDTPNYSEANGSQFGVTCYPPGTEPPRRSCCAGFTPMRAKNSSYTGGQAMPGVFPSTATALPRPGTRVWRAAGTGTHLRVQYPTRPDTRIRIRCRDWPRANMRRASRRGLWNDTRVAGTDSSVHPAS